MVIFPCMSLVTLVVCTLLPTGSHGGLEMLARLFAISDGNSCPSTDVRCDSGECILKKWRCDTQKDCKDGSDEENCPTPNCSAREFACDKVRCVPIDYRCDGTTDCKDESDERQDVCDQPCPEDTFRCSDGRCIVSHWKCDNEKDCKGGEDEAEQLCSRPCGAKEWRCLTGDRCIPENQRCDRYHDCTDLSDESPLMCSQLNVVSSCNGTDFRCADGTCIQERFLCDGNRDCSANEDELLFQCPKSAYHSLFDEKRSPTTNSCLPDDFTCANGECIPSAWRCDGSTECEDGSDEICTDTPAGRLEALRKDSCPVGQVSCATAKNTSACLRLDQLCDKKMDCLDGSDEGEKCSSACGKNNGRCGQICHPTPLGAACGCRSGFVLAEDKKVCEEADPCIAGGSISGPCGHFCHSFRGLVKCTCYPGFRLEPDNRSCKPIENPIIAYSAGPSVEYFMVHKKERGILVKGGFPEQKGGLEVGPKSDKIFYTDMTFSGIFQSQKGSSQPQRILGKTLLTPEGLAYDWTAENLYYADSKKPEIGVCYVGGKEPRCTVLLGEDELDSPRGIAVHPGKQYLFFSQWEKVSLIERVLLDGSERTAIISKKLVWPNSLTIDYIHERLYWLDAHYKWIESTTLDGDDHRTVLHMRQAHPYGLTILGNRLYWTDWYFEVVASILTNGSDHQVAQTNSSQLMSIIAIHPSRQPAFNSVCVRDGNRTPCTHICLARSNTSYVCACRTGYILVDSTNCVPQNGSVMPVKLGGSSAGPGFTKTDEVCKIDSDCICPGLERSQPHDSCLCMSNRCHLIVSKIVEASHHSRISTAYSGISTSSVQEQHSPSTLAGIVCASILFVVFIVIVSFLYHKYRSSSGESDEKLLDSDTESAVKKPRRCPSVLGGFTNPVYDSVTAPANYMVKFYKTRRSCSSDKVPGTPVSGCEL